MECKECARKAKKVANDTYRRGNGRDGGVGSKEKGFRKKGKTSIM